MLARCARMAPAMAFKPSPPDSASTARCLSCCTTLIPLFSGNVSEPLVPLTVMLSAPMVALTPWGRSTGFFATRDMVRSLPLLNDEEHFAAGAGRARLPVRHDALRGRNHGDAEAAQYLEQFVLAAIDAKSRTADALDAI